MKAEAKVIRSHTDLSKMKKIQRKKTAVSVMKKETLEERVRQFAEEYKLNRR